MYIILYVILLKHMSPFPIEALYACSAAGSSRGAGGVGLGWVCEALKQMHHWQEPAPALPNATYAPRKARFFRVSCRRLARFRGAAGTDEPAARCLASALGTASCCCTLLTGWGCCLAGVAGCWSRAVSTEMWIQAPFERQDDVAAADLLEVTELMH